MTRQQWDVEGRRRESEEIWVSAVLGLLEIGVGGTLMHVIMLGGNKNHRVHAHTHTYTQRKSKHGGSFDVLLMLKLVRPIGTIYEDFSGNLWSKFRTQELDAMTLRIIEIWYKPICSRCYVKLCVNLVIFNIDLDRSALQIIRDQYM